MRGNSQTKAAWQLMINTDNDSIRQRTRLIKYFLEGGMFTPREKIPARPPTIKWKRVNHRRILFHSFSGFSSSLHWTWGNPTPKKEKNSKHHVFIYIYKILDKSSWFHSNYSVLYSGRRRPEIQPRKEIWFDTTRTKTIGRRYVRMMDGFRLHVHLYPR